MFVSTERMGSFLVVWIDNPPLNVLSHGVRAGIMTALEQAQDDAAIAAAVIIGKGRAFIAGADVREFNAPAQQPLLTDCIAAMEQARLPLVAAIHGVALGGGFELAMGAHYRVATPTAKIGLPEVKLGIIPGAGGTVRLPHLVAWDRALDLVSSGRHLPAKEACEWGAIDEIVDGDLLQGALRFAEKVTAQPLPLAVKDRPLPTAPEAQFWEEWTTKLRSKVRGQDSPMYALRSVQNACEMPFAKAYAEERRIFLQLRESDQARALRYGFFAERAAAKSLAGEPATARPVSTVAVIGGGTMGSGITASFIGAGFEVVLVEKAEESLAVALERVRQIFDSGRKRGLLTEADYAHRIGALQGTSEMAQIAQMDMVVEAVFEDMEIKKELFARLDVLMKEDAILATNTSYLDVNEIARSVRRRQDVVGLHFFSPAHIMKLLEVIRTDDSHPDVLASCFEIAKKLGKVAVLSGVCEGFIGNRLLKIYRRQADYLLEDGCLPSDIDRAMRAFGMPMGPYEAQDLSGLDIGWANRQRTQGSRPANERYVAIADRLCEMGRFGQKTGSGWYRYEANDRKPHEDPQVAQIILEEASRNGVKRRSFDEHEIQQRILLPMANEGFKIVAEGIAQRPLDVDMVEVHGYGFPRWRGGLLYYAEQFGLDRVLSQLEEWMAEDSHAYVPCELLKTLVAEGKSIASLNEPEGQG